MTATLTALANALGPWPLAFVLVGAVAIVTSAIVLIVLRSKIALDVSRDSKNKWRVRFVRIEEGGRIGDLPRLMDPAPLKSAGKVEQPSARHKSP